MGGFVVCSGTSTHTPLRGTPEKTSGPLWGTFWGHLEKGGMPTLQGARIHPYRRALETLVPGRRWQKVLAEAASAWGPITDGRPPAPVRELVTRVGTSLAHRMSSGKGRRRHTALFMPSLKTSSPRG